MIIYRRKDYGNIWHWNSGYVFYWVTDEKIFYFHKYIIFLFKCSKIKFAIPIVSTFSCPSDHPDKCFLKFHFKSEFKTQCDCYNCPPSIYTLRAEQCKARVAFPCILSCINHITSYIDQGISSNDGLFLLKCFYQLTHVFHCFYYNSSYKAL